MRPAPLFSMSSFMAQHYQKWVTETYEYCGTCRRQTKHQVSGCRLGPCTEHGPKANGRGESKEQERKRLKREHDQQNPTLF